MRKTAACLLVLLSAGLSAVGSAQPRLAVVASLGLTSGQTHEIVYKSATSSAYTSELIWPTPPSAAVRVEARGSWGAFETRLGAGAAFPLLSGVMTDDDFSISGGSSTLYNVQSVTPAFALSDSEIWLEQLGTAKNSWGSLSALIGLKTKRLAWESWTDPEGNQQIWTPVDGSTATAFDLYGLVITFRQNRIVPYAGVEARGLFGTRGVVLGLRASPWLIALDTDFHVPSTVYFDATMGGFELEPRAEISFPLAPGWELGLRTTFTWAALVRGTTLAVASRTQDSGTEYENQAGTGWQSVNIDVFLKN